MESSGNGNDTSDGACTVSLQNITAFDFSSLLVPSNNSSWETRSDVWYGFFYVMIVLFVLLFLMLGVACILLMVKRHLAQRFKVRTFLAIDVILMILGFSRVLFLLLDPWGQLPTKQFCKHEACTIVSRLLFALGFPSLTASYTLVFITLWMSANMQLGLPWVQRLKFLIPLCFVHYVFAIVFEAVGMIPVVSREIVTPLLISCESCFALAGFLVCFAFLFAGLRLLKSVEKSARAVSQDTPQMSRRDFIEKSKFKNRERSGQMRSQTTLKLKHMLRDKQMRAIRKITRITFVTATLGMLYSIVTIVNLVLVCLTLFQGCPGLLFGEEQYPAVWLVIRYALFSLEIGLAILLTYAINDYRPVAQFMKNCIKLCCGLRKGAAPPDTVEDATSRTQPSPLIGRQGQKFLLNSRESLNESLSTVEGTPSPKRHDTIHTPSLPSPLLVSHSVNEERRVVKA